LEVDDTVVEGFRPRPEVYGEGRREVVGRVEVVEDRSGSEEVKDTSISFTFLPVPSPAPQHPDHIVSTSHLPEVTDQWLLPLQMTRNQTFL